MKELIISWFRQGRFLCGFTEMFDIEKRILIGLLNNNHSKKCGKLQWKHLIEIHF